MSVQMVLLPVFVLVGLAFVLLLWMAGAGRRRDQNQGHRAERAELARPGHADRQLLQQPVRSAAIVLHPDRTCAAAASRGLYYRGVVVGICGHAFRPRRNFCDLQ